MITICVVGIFFSSSITQFSGGTLWRTTLSLFILCWLCSQVDIYERINFTHYFQADQMYFISFNSS